MLSSLLTDETTYRLFFCCPSSVPCHVEAEDLVGGVGRWSSYTSWTGEEKKSTEETGLLGLGTSRSRRGFYVRLNRH